MLGLPVDLREVRAVLCSKMLLKVNFFKTLQQRTRDQLGAILDIEYFESHTDIFREGDIADKLYIVVDGQVAIYKRTAEGFEEVVATYQKGSQQTTFGEAGVWRSDRRRGTARTIAPTNLLVLSAANFPTFLEILPQYAEIAGANTAAFDKLAKLKAREEELAASVKEADAALLVEQGKLDDAEPLLRRALKGRESVLGNKHPDTLVSMDSLAKLLKQQGKYHEAEPLFRKALKGRETVLGVSHPDTLLTVRGLADLLMNMGKYGAEAAVLRRRIG